MIGGTDIVIPNPGLPVAQAMDTVVRCARGRWAGAILQDSGGRRFRSYREGPFGRVRELFVYKDEQAFLSWERVGAKPENANSMIHLIADDYQLTVVVDDEHDATMRS